MNNTIENKPNQNSLISDVSENDFVVQVIEASNEKIILADFWAPWCNPCKQLSPVLEEVVQEAQGDVKLVKINIDENQQLAAQLRIQSIPTVIAFNKKKIVNSFQGVLPKQQIIKFIENISGASIQKNNTEFYEIIHDLINNNESEKAISLLEKFLGENSKDTKAISFYIMCLTELKKFDELNDFIDSLSETLVTNQEVQSSISNFKIIKKTFNDSPLDKLLEIYAEDPKNVENIIKLSAKYFAEKKYEKAFTLLIENFLKQQNKDKEKIKQKLINYFNALGNDHEQTKIYRKKLSSLLYS